MMVIERLARQPTLLRGDNSSSIKRVMGEGDFFILKPGTQPDFRITIVVHEP